jgi:L-lactate dehydrogenase
MADGGMAKAGAPEIVSDRGACLCWNGRRLPGVWLVAEAVRLACERAATYGTVTVAIGNAHHIASLSAYLPEATDKGLMVLIGSSDPSQANVAPFGGARPLYSPNPIAAGIPTDGDPILIDTSASITTNNMNQRLLRRGGQYEHAWLLDSEGVASRNPAVIRDGGSILPAGGLDHGQKGYAWGLLVEALTQGLAGFGRADAPRGWGASVFVQVIDPQAFGGRGSFTRQTGFLAQACRDNPPRPGVDRVRTPGDGALAKRRAQLASGVELDDEIVEQLRSWAQKLNVTMPLAAA